MLKILEKEIQIALSVYSSDNIDVVYDTQLQAYFIMYHSNNNSFDLGGYVRADDKNMAAVQKLCDKYDIGYGES